MTLPVTTYSPKVRVSIYTDRHGLYDLTDRDLLSLSTRRGIGDSTGKWDMLLSGRKTEGESFLTHIQPMDYVEIKFARSPSQAGGLPIVMRGFVDNITENTASGEKRVSLNGRDYGKIMLKVQVYYLDEINPTLSLIQQAGLEQRFQIPAGILTPAAFVNLVNDNIVAPNLAAMRGNRGWMPNMRVDVSVPDRFAINGLAVQPFTGSVWNLITQFASKPWIEAFITDRPSGPTLVYRFAPLRSYAATALASYAPSVDVTTIYASDVIAMNVGLSDNEVYSYYFTYPQYNLLDRIDFKAEGIDLARNPYLDQSKLERYGFMPLEVSTPLIPSLVPDPANVAATKSDQSLELAAELNQWLYAANQSNHQFLNGSLTIKGGGGIQPGTYLQVADLDRFFYVAGASHHFSIAEGQVRTTLDVVRGSPMPRGSGVRGI
jgi:hypothetical protein